VIGIIHAFEVLSLRQGTRLASGGAGGVSEGLMLAVAEALVATAVGILVAIPAVATFNALQRRVSALLAETEVLGNLVLAYLADRTTGSEAHPQEDDASDWPPREPVVPERSENGLRLELVTHASGKPRTRSRTREAPP
ncbi:MAG: MotA/TolQ/ExbB proton channel family protein, partial [Myxococcota bacterium]|nr:MotA/TolQ/ExbB proton channel family protein [Myxococcota bacterium]